MKADDVLAFDDLRTKTVSIAQWGGAKFTVRELGLAQGLELFAMFGGETAELTGEQVAKVVAWGVIDANTGERVFTDDHVPKLAQKNRDALLTLYRAITALSSEDARKNSKASRKR